MAMKREVNYVVIIESIEMVKTMYENVFENKDWEPS